MHASYNLICRAASKATKSIPPLVNSRVLPRLCRCVQECFPLLDCASQHLIFGSWPAFQSRWGATHCRNIANCANQMFPQQAQELCQGHSMHNNRLTHLGEGSYRLHRKSGNSRPGGANRSSQVLSQQGQEHCQGECIATGSRT